MSHLTQIQVVIQDLAALKAACKALGLEWMENQKTYQWFGRFVGGSPMPEGFTIDDLGKCSHAIRVPDETYEIGVVRKDSKWRLVYDGWGNGIARKLGSSLEKVAQQYGIAKVRIEARKKGLNMAMHTLPSGAVCVTIGGRL